MATALFSWKNDEVVNFAAQLQKVHRAALPNAVRFTLNDAVFNAKRKTLRSEAEKQFKVRQKTFFSGKPVVVNKALGWDMSKMNANVGMKKDMGGSQATKGVAKQEFGGDNKRAAIASKNNRTKSGKLKKKYSDEIQKINRGVVRVRNGRPVKQARMIAIKEASKTGKLLLMKSKKSNRDYLYEVTASSNIKSRKQKFKFNRIASYSKGRTQTLGGKDFMASTGMVESKNLNSYFRKEADRQLKKFIK